MQIVEKQRRLAALDIPQLDAIGKTGFRIGDEAPHAEASQLLVREPVEATKGRGVKAGNAEGHGNLLKLSSARPGYGSIAPGSSRSLLRNQKGASRRIVEDDA
jgi:hypothetical protein